MILNSFAQLEAKLAGYTEPRKLAVAGADSVHTMQAVCRAADKGLVHPILIGAKDRVTAVLDEIGYCGAQPEIIHADDGSEASRIAAELARAGAADCIMKGGMETAVLMRELVNREHGIRTDRTISMMAVIESPYYKKLFAITDVGLLIRPTLEQKRSEIENAVDVFHRLGVDEPKVAVLTAVEKVNQKMPETVDADALKRMGIPGCIVEGPIAYDLALSSEAASDKNYSSPVAGDADILLVPDIVSGNIAVKSMTTCGGGHSCGAVVGTMVPVVMSSRSSPPDDKYMSIVLSALIGGKR